jgi:hypothetical protein
MICEYKNHDKVITARLFIFSTNNKRQVSFQMAGLFLQCNTCTRHLERRCTVLTGYLDKTGVKLDALQHMGCKQPLTIEEKTPYTVIITAV